MSTENEPTDVDVVKALDHNKRQLRLICRLSPVVMLVSGVPILLAATSDAAPGSIMALTDSIGKLCGIAGIGASLCFGISAWLRLKILEVEERSK